MAHKLAENYNRFFGKNLQEEEGIDISQFSDRWEIEGNHFISVQSAMPGDPDKENRYFYDYQRVPEFAKDILSSSQVSALEKKIEELDLGEFSELDIYGDEGLDAMMEFDSVFCDMMMDEIAKKFDNSRDELDREVDGRDQWGWVSIWST